MPAGVFVPERWIPAPTTVSKEAQAFLANPPRNSSPPAPAQNDKKAWRAYIAEGNERLEQLLVRNKELYPAQIETRQLSATHVYEVTPANLSQDGLDRAICYIHGGSYIHGAGLSVAYMAMPLASTSRIRAFAVDYRKPPDHPFPAGLDDALECYRVLLQKYRPEHIAVAGGSAGGGLAASLVLKIRDLGLPPPGCCALSSPEADLTESGDTFRTNDTIDVVLKHGLPESIALYANGHDLRDPYLSAIYGDFSKGYPPSVLVSGTRDLFLSNTVRLHRAMRRGGIDADLHVFEAMPHGGFFGAPEDQESLQLQARFIRGRLALE
jgi:acetyl esterase/lipase